MTWLDDLQRRLAIAGARGLGHEFADQIGRTFRGESQQDVWETATKEPPHGSAGSAPECAWCPVCRAIRMARESRPDLTARVSETTGTLMAAAQDAIAALDAALSRVPTPPPGQTAPAAAPPGSGASSPGAGPAATGRGASQAGTGAAPGPAAPPVPSAAQHGPTAPAATPGGDAGGPEPSPPPSPNGQQG